MDEGIVGMMKAFTEATEALATNSGITREEAKKIMDDFLKAYGGEQVCDDKGETISDA